MMYSVDIAIDMEILKKHENLISKDQVKSIFEKPDLRIRFTTEEEKEKYLKDEYKYTTPQLKAYAAAWTKTDREYTKAKLYLARRNFHVQYFKKEDTKQTA